MLDIPANDHGALYVVEYSGPPLDGPKEQMIRKIIGQDGLNLDYVDLIPASQTGDVALPDLIRQGYDLPLTPAQATTLRRVSGMVVLIMSRAFGGKAQTIFLPDDTRTVMVLRETPQLGTVEKLTSEGAVGELNGRQAKPRKSDARMSGMVATAALLVMFALVGLMIWVGR
ncbi:hypothetical protein [Yoonia sp.]|uniref:hypothetical protein n=1 Tax=Yoonia sp. TaxID=2212373 RepID=UPI00391977E0